MKKLPLLMFLFIMASAFCTSICSYRCAENRITADIDNALKMALAKMPTDVVSVDTIRCYRNYLSIPELKDTACIAMRTVRINGRQRTEIVAEANCDFMTVFMLSDQRVSGILLLTGLMWMAGSMWYVRRYRPELIMKGVRYGGITFNGNMFVNTNGEIIHLTPMQFSLLEMFMNSENHTLSKQDICERLWPKKPDATDTLYTLIKRTKPIIETNSNLKIESDRGRSYSLILK